MSIDTRCGRRSFWTIVARHPFPKAGEHLRRVYGDYVEGCHKHPTRALAERCERKRPWTNEHVVVKVENGTEITGVATR